MTELTLKIYAGALAFWLLFYCFIKVAELRFPPWAWTIMQCIAVFFYHHTARFPAGTDTQPCFLTSTFSEENSICNLT